MSGAHDDRVAGHDRSGIEPDVGFYQVHLLVVIQLEIDDTILAEGRYRRTGPGIERDQPVALGDVQNSLLLAVGPVGQAAAGKLPRSSRAASSFVLGMHPQQLARRRIQRNHGTPRSSRGVEDSVHHQRG